MNDIMKVFLGNVQQLFVDFIPSIRDVTRTTNVLKSDLMAQSSEHDKQNSKLAAVAEWSKALISLNL